ncbi:IS3 family transposase [Clostridium celatum]|uniref:IS3 family transposase n=1 Tax=Clostridium celatum TaxID=36834 RepID=UPI003C2C7971
MCWDQTCLLNSSQTKRYKENKVILYETIKLYSKVKRIYGYRRITLNINNRLNSNYNHKRIYGLIKSVKLTAVIRRKKKKYIQSIPQITAENILNRKFVADNTNEKWLTELLTLR